MWRLIKVRSHICARALQKTTIESDSSKVEVVGKNFCFFQISISLNAVVEMYVYPPTASCALSLTVDAFKRFFSSIQRHIDPVSMYTGFLRKKKTADDARFSPTAQPTCPPSCSNTPEKQLQNVKYSACAYQDAFKEFTDCDSNVLLFISALIIIIQIC